MSKRRISVLMLAVLMSMALLQGCGRDNSAANGPEIGREQESVASGGTTAENSEDGQGRADHDEASDSSDSLEEKGAASTKATEIDPAVTTPQIQAADIFSADAETDSIPDNTKENTLYIQIGDQTMTAALVENSSTEALKELLAQGPITIDMRDYGNFEKVGELGTNLPTNDVSITSEPGDLILYQGNSLVIYYAPNTWSFTRLGKINDMTEDELKEILGSGNVSVTISLSGKI